MVAGLLGLVLGACFGPIPGIIGLVLGLIALQQIKKSPETTGGKPLAIIGIVTGSLSIAFYLLLLLWFALAGVFGGF